MEGKQQKNWSKALIVLYLSPKKEDRELLSAMLEKSVKVIHTAEGKEQGKSLYQKDHPNLIILDPNLPDALSFVEEIRGHDRQTPIVIAIEEGKSIENLWEFSQFGIEGVIPSPFQAEILLNLLQRCAKNYLQNRKIGNQKSYISFVLESSPYLGFSMKGNQLRELNSAFLRFLGFASTEAFKEEHHSVEKFFLHDFSTSWVEYILQYPSHNILQKGEDTFLVFAFEEGHERIFFLANEKDLNRIATTDHLTGLSSQVKFLEILDMEMIKAVRSKSPVSVIRLEVDQFSYILQKYGEREGNEVLKGIARIVTSNVRISDSFTRLNRAKFALLFPGMRGAVAEKRIEKIQKDIKSTNFYEVQSVTCNFEMEVLKEGSIYEDVVHWLESPFPKN